MRTGNHTIPQLVNEIRSTCDDVHRRLQVMEICGTHTVSLFRTGVKSLLPDSLRMVSGPGCPVCVTSQGYIDAACELAGRPEVTICTYSNFYFTRTIEISLIRFVCSDKLIVEYFFIPWSSTILCSDHSLRNS